ncbi:MAG: DUF6495 family protein [Saprospiraceae bacterium]
MKYRLLNLEELADFQDEFVNFLVVHGIDAAEWVSIKKEDLAKAQHFIEVFSDFIFDGIVAQVAYLEYHDTHGIKLFKCDDDIIHLINIECENPDQSMEGWESTIGHTDSPFNYFEASKSYQPDRSTEIWRMISAGAHITQGEIFEKMALNE